MFVFGHLGLGYQLAAPWRKRLPKWPLLAGMLLPDVIDKPLYYLRLSDYISCTRTFGHTGLAILLAMLVGVAFRKPAWLALSLGMATHVLLDCALDVFVGDGPSSTWIAVTWPLHGAQFAHVYIGSFAAHADLLLRSPVVVSELLGMMAIVFELWKGRRATRPAVSEH
jgi:hypothetical protein